MFDDLKQDNNQVAPSSVNPGSAIQTQTPKPMQKTSGIDDMFGDVDPAPALPSLGGSTELDSVDSNKPSAVQSGKLKPISQTNPMTSVVNLESSTAPTPIVQTQIPATPAPQAMATPNIPSANSMVVSDDRSMGFMRKFIVTMSVIFLLTIVGGGIYYFFLRDDGVNTNENLNQDINNNTNENLNQDINNNVNEPIINEDDLDDDFDGLSNGLEKSYGTNPLEPDTDNDGIFDQDEVEIYHTDPLADDSDNDGLSDYEEIIIYKTDPNDLDTDGDTFSDGVEISNGYNPLGNGKLEDTLVVDNINENL